MTYVGADDGQTLGSVFIDSTHVNNVRMAAVALQVVFLQPKVPKSQECCPHAWWPSLIESSNDTCRRSLPAKHNRKPPRSLWRRLHTGKPQTEQSGL